MPASQVRQLFDKTDPAVVGGFWTRLKESAQADVYAKALYVYQGENNGLCTIAVTPSGALYSQPIILLSKDEGGYKYGLVESKLPNR